MENQTLNNDFKNNLLKWYINRIIEKQSLKEESVAKKVSRCFIWDVAKGSNKGPQTDLTFSVSYFDAHVILECVTEHHNF